MRIDRLLQKVLVVFVALCIALTGFRTQAVPIIVAGVTASGFSSADVYNPSATEVARSFDVDPYVYSSGFSVPFADYGGVGVCVEGASASIAEGWTVSQTSFSFQAPVNLTVESEALGAYAAVNVSLGVILDIGALCSYAVYDVAGNVVTRGTISPGPWNLNLNWNAEIEGAGEEQDLFYYDVEFSDYNQTIPATVPDDGSTILLMGMSFIGLTFVMRLNREPRLRCVMLEGNRIYFDRGDAKNLRSQFYSARAS